VEKINETIPEEDFVIELPDGTPVSDQRKSRGTSFTVGQISRESLAGLNIQPAPPPSWWGLYWYVAVILGVGTAILAIGFYVVLRRRVFRPSQG
jgi:hypothetical protein